MDRIYTEKGLTERSAEGSGFVIENDATLNEALKQEEPDRPLEAP